LIWKKEIIPLYSTLNANHLSTFNLGIQALLAKIPYRWWSDVK